MRVWMVPRGFDLGGTLAVWTMNFLIGGLIGSVVLLAMVGQAIIYLSVFLLTVITGIHKNTENKNEIDLFEKQLRQKLAAFFFWKLFATQCRKSWDKLQEKETPY